MGVDYANYALYAVHVISEKLYAYAIDNLSKIFIPKCERFSIQMDRNSE